MRPRTSRPFRISDAIVLVAATGFGLAGCRFWLWATKKGWSDLWPTGDEPMLARLQLATLRAIPVASILLLSWTTAVLLLRLRPIRPRRRHLWCQPGFLACVAVLLAFTWRSAGVMLLVAVEVLTASPAQLARIDYGTLAGELGLMMLGFQLAPQADVGGAILLIWLVTWASGRCRPELSWVDRSGRVLGAVWLGISLLSVSAAISG